MKSSLYLGYSYKKTNLLLLVKLSKETNSVCFTKQSKKNNKDVVGMPCIHGIDGNIKVSLKDEIKCGSSMKKKAVK